MPPILTRLLSLFLVALPVIGCRYDPAPARVETSADTTAGEVAFELAGPGGAALTVPVHLNGEGPYRFVLDTGATLTCVDPSLAREMTLPERQGQVGVGASVSGSGQVQLVGVDTLRVGSARAYDLTVCTVDLQQLEGAGLTVDGLLGLNFLRSFHVTLDFDRQVVALRAPASTADG